MTIFILIHFLVLGFDKGERNSLGNSVGERNSLGNSVREKMMDCHNLTNQNGQT
jgi:hypothetical protein